MEKKGRNLLPSNKRRESLRRILFVFVTLLLASTAMILAAKYAPVDSFQQSVLISIGSAIAGSALTFFLLQMSAWDSQREAEEERESPARQTHPHAHNG